MSQVTVSDQALRELVREALDGGHLGDLTIPEEEPAPVNVNPVVDPSAAETDPINPCYTPQTKQELDVAVRNLVKNLPVDKVPAIYKTIHGAVDAMEDDMEDADTDKKAEQGGTDQVEEAIRREVRKVLHEINPRFDASFSGTDYGDSGDEDEEEDDDDEDKPRRAYKKTALGNMNDVNYDETKGEHAPKSFEEIAKGMEFSVAGAKQAVDKAVEQFGFMYKLWSDEPDDYEILILSAMNDYIKMLNKTGELSAADVRLMKDHPDIVRELDGFREFLHNSIRRARKGAALENPLGEDD